MNVGLFFGSFNPIHIGHLIIAESLLESTPLEQVWLVISPQNPFKEKKSLLNAYDRYRLAEIATADNPRIFPSNVEFNLPTPSYTIDTLTELTRQFPTYDFSLLMGGDNLGSLHKWKKAEVIVQEYNIYAYPRKESKPPQVESPRIQQAEAPLMEISATNIRKRLAEDRSVRYLLPPEVIRYIREHNLYT